VPTAAPRAPAPVQPTGKVESWEEHIHRCKAGETFESISNFYFGTPAYAQALAQYNRADQRAGDALRQGGALKEGDTLFVPPAELLKQRFGSAPLAPPGR
jgi:hypothetical protein